MTLLAAEHRQRSQAQDERFSTTFYKRRAPPVLPGTVRSRPAACVDVCTDTHQLGREGKVQRWHHSPHVTC